MTTAPDMTASIAPRSDQLNAEDLLTGPQTITITDVKRGTAEQPVDFVTEEYGPGRPYKPSKTMRRMIVAAWGKNTADYIGRRITIYRDPDITFGRDRVGGIRISHLSHIDERLELALTVTRGRRASFAVDPLADRPNKPTLITKAEGTEFERRIADAASNEELDAIAKDLKARELGAFHEHLLSVFSDRRAALAKPAEPSDIPAKSIEDNVTPPDVTMATRQQITKLKQLRQAEKYDDDPSWFDYVFNTTGARVTADDQLTADQAQRIINLFNN